MEFKDKIRQNYNEKVQTSDNKMLRELSKTYQLKAFNNWIKAVLIQTQTKKMCKKIQQELDLKKGGDRNILHVLDIGCGRGQDILKWKLARVQYMVAIDFSEECVKTYQQKWRNAREPFRLYTSVQDFTSRNLYSEIEHSYYDIVSAQFCFHYMFGTQQGLKQGLAAVLSNLLIEGVFLATIPDSYTIIKKIEEHGVTQSDGSKVYSNSYFSIKFDNTNFTSPYGNMYGFYLDKAVGKKNEDGTIQYTNEWLIQLDHLSKYLQTFGVEIQETMNFIEYYKKYRDEYKELFAKFKLIFQPGQAMSKELWEIAHLYRVLICKKKSKGMHIYDFNIKDRLTSIKKEVKGTNSNYNNNSGGYRNYNSSNHRQNSYQRDNFSNNRQGNNYNRQSYSNRGSYNNRNNHNSRSRDYK